jgi:hypothetical protein
MPNVGCVVSKTRKRGVLIFSKAAENKDEQQNRQQYTAHLHKQGTTVLPVPTLSFLSMVNIKDGEHHPFGSKPGDIDTMHHTYASDIVTLKYQHSLKMITRELHTWNKTDDGTVGDSEEFTTNTSLDMPSFFFYAALSLFSFILLFQVYLKCRYRASDSVDAEIPESQASYPGVEVSQKSVGERRKELLAGFEEHKVERVSKLKIVKTCF